MGLRLKEEIEIELKFGILKFKGLFDRYTSLR